MKEAGLPFTAPMVRAVIRKIDPKTQTRRLRGLEKINQAPDRWAVEQDGLIDLPGAPYTGKRGVLFRDAGGTRVFVPALYAADTLLWIREGWRLPITLDEFSPGDVGLRTTLAGGRPQDLPIQYEADQACHHWNGDFEPGRYRHGRFMPRWASRINLEFLGERVERLQDISEADAIAEGIEPELDGWLDYSDPSCQMCMNPIDSYRTLWESINGPGSWEANPWVRVVEFRRIEAKE